MLLRSMLTSMVALAGSRDLLWTWTLRTIRARYQRSVLGWLWALVQPAAQVAIFTLIFTYVVPIDTHGVPYVLFTYVAVTPWTFLAAALTDMCTSIIDNLSLVTKIYFPREILPLSAMLARLFDFGVASLLVAALILVFHTAFDPWRLLLLPVVLVVQVALVLGLGLAAAAGNTLVRDVRPLLLLVLQLWFYLSPVIYPVESVPAHLRGWYALNPAVGILGTHRAIWLNDPIPVGSLGISAVAATVCLIGGYAVFKRAERIFADIA